MLYKIDYSSELMDWTDYFRFSLRRLFFIKKMWANPGLFFVYFSLFKHNFTEKTVGLSGIRTHIVGVEGKHAENLTTTTTAPFTYKIVI